MNVFEVIEGLNAVARKLAALGACAVRIRMHPETHSYALALLPTASPPSGNIVDFTGVRFDADPDVPRGVARVMYSDGREEEVQLGTQGTRPPSNEDPYFEDVSGPRCPKCGAVDAMLEEVLR